MANWKKVLVSGSEIDVRSITASAIPETTAGDSKFLVYNTSTGNFAYTASGGGGGGGTGIFGNQGTYYSTENSLQVSGSTLQEGPEGSKTVTEAASFANNNYAFIVSESAYFTNHNVGHPNSLTWQSNLEGSIFNDYDASTDVSEILRTLVGIISSSHPSTVASPTPNTKTFADFTSTLVNDGTATRGSTTFPVGRVPKGTTDEDVLYTIAKDFTDYGEQLMGNISTIYNNTNLHWTWKTNDAGSTTISSDAGDLELIGLGRKASPGVRIEISNTRQWDHDGTSFVVGDAIPSNGGAFSGSIHRFDASALDTTTEGITLNNIETGNPTVIPGVFIDGKASGLRAEPGTSHIFMSDNNNIGGHAATSISSSGWYKHDISYIRVYTGSQTSNIAFQQTTGAPSPVFWAPIGQSGIFGTLTSQLSNDTSFTADLVTSASFTSRSLSGAPYLNGATYTFSTSASNAFKPVYTTETNITSETIVTTDFVEDSTHGDDVSNSDFATTGFTTTTQNGSGQISNAGTVYNSGTDQNGDVPNMESEIHLTKTETLDFGGSLGGTKTNTTAVTSNAISDQFTARFTVNKIDTDGTAGTINKNFTQRPHLAGHFGQPASSGSMLLFGSSDGDDGDTSQSTTVGIEKFLGEGNRRTIGDATTTGELSNAFDSGSRLSNSAPRDAQVKPGYLVIPGSSYGYWYPASYYNSANYYWYLREFDFGTPGSPSQLKVEVIGAHTDTTPALTAMSSTGADSLSIGVIFEHGVGTGAGSRTNIVDLTKTVSSDVANGDSNPFTSNVNFTSWVGGSAYDASTAEATIIFAGTPGQPLINNTYSKAWVLVRMRGDVANANGLEEIKLTVS